MKMHPFLFGFFQSFPDAVQIGGAEGAVEQAVAGFAGFAPDHAAVVRTDISIKMIFVKRTHDFHHVKGAVGREVAAFFETAVLLISPLELHQPVIQPGKEPYERVVLWVNRSYLERLSSAESDLTACFDLNSPRHTNLLRLDAVSVRRLQDMADALIAEREERAFGWDLNSRALLTRVFVELNRQFLEAPVVFEVPDASGSIISEVLRYIDCL